MVDTIKGYNRVWQTGSWQRSVANFHRACEVAHRSASVGHLGVIAIKTGRKIRFDPGKEKIVGDTTAERLLGRAYRSPRHY